MVQNSIGNYLGTYISQLCKYHEELASENVNRKQNTHAA